MVADLLYPVFSSTFLHCRILPAFGIAGVLNTRVKDWCEIIRNMSECANLSKQMGKSCCLVLLVLLSALGSVLVPGSRMLIQ